MVVVWYQLEALHGKIRENFRQDLSSSVKRRYFGQRKDLPSIVVRDKICYVKIKLDLAQNRDQWRARMDTVMNLRVPLNVRKFLSNWVTGGFSRRTQLYGDLVS
jgi:hypothetical protein